ncbi:MAG: hypothetical protein J7L03_04955 [Caldisericaceae bacterium]|nr:hypothetical protein [Caldisericaceae bacterium]
MGITKEKAILYCIHCGKETPHELVYIGNELQKIKCLTCGMEIFFDKKKLLLTYSEDLVKRILTKPSRISKEALGDLSDFLETFPLRVITKPKRMVDEIKDILK